MNADPVAIPKIQHKPTGRGQSTRESEFATAYGAQLSWSQLSVKERLSRIRPLRKLIVENRDELANSIQTIGRQGYGETLASEIMPLADTARWLERRARKILEPRYATQRRTPLWLGALHSTILRVPHGLVLIIGASNYPLFLTGSQVLHALVAGNGVVIKPAPGAEKVTRLFARLLEESGIPEGLVVVLDSTVEAGQHAIDIGVDHVVLTGSSRSGRKVASQLAETLTPAVMELSGCDSMYVLPGADMHRVCDVLLFGLRLNGGATCMAPRRVFVPKKASEVFHRLLRQRLTSEYQSQWRTKIPTAVYNNLADGVRDAISKGAKLVETEDGWLTSGDNSFAPESISHASSHESIGHVVLTDMTPDMSLSAADIFAPLAMILPVEDWADALQADSQCPYALTASIYGPTEDALRIAKYITAGTITINDTIVPTADPQLPFGGRGESGYGVTRGDEGLLSMTVPKVISLRKGNWLPHANSPSQADELLLDGLLQCSHAGSWLGRWNGLQQLVKAAMAMRQTKQSTKERG